MTDPRPNRLMLRLKEPTRERLMILAREAGATPLDYLRVAIEWNWAERGRRLAQDERSYPCSGLASGRNCKRPAGHQGPHVGYFFEAVGLDD